MALMTVDGEGSSDSRSGPHWSADKKMDVVLQLLRGEKLEELFSEVASGPIGSPRGETSCSRAAEPV